MTLSSCRNRIKIKQILKLGEEEKNMAQTAQYNTPFGEFSEDLQNRITSGEISEHKVTEFLEFLDEINGKFMKHRVISHNEYCQWFNKGTELRHKDVRDMYEQFSVFSHLFLIAQMKKMINSTTIEQYRASKEILANEIGVIFHKKGAKKVKAAEELTEDEKDEGGDPSIVSTVGSVDGGTFRFAAGHFEWLFKIGQQLGVTDFSTVGKRRHGTEATLFFCDELERLYGSDDANVGAGASFSVENWAAAGFWKDLISGLRIFKEKHADELPNGLSLGFFTWHDKIEDQHAEHVLEELEEAFFEDWFNKKEYIRGGMEMLDGVMAFWDGLNKTRLAN